MQHTESRVMLAIEKVMDTKNTLASETRVLKDHVHNG